MLTILKTFIFIFGICIGSFLNCVIFRMEKEESIKGRSCCPKCKHKLSFFDLFPVVSFLFLKGRCIYCKEKISFQYPLIEIISGVSFLFLFNHLVNLKNKELIADIFDFQFLFIFFILASILSLLIIVFVYDFKHFLIPDIVVYLLIFFALLYSIYNKNLLNNFFSGFVAFLFFLFIFLITKGKGMGFGDVNLSIFVGLFLGYPNFLVALFTSFLIGAIMGIGLIVFKGKTLKAKIPFGPFMIIGTVVAFFYGEVIIEYYLLFSYW